LKIICLIVHLSYEDGQFAEHVGVDDGAGEEAQAAVEDLEGGAGADVVAGGQHDGGVEGDEVAVGQRLVIDHIEVLIIVVHRWDPHLLHVNHEVPNTPETVQVQHQEKYQLQQLQKRLHLLIAPQICDNLIQAHHSYQLHRAKDFEVDGIGPLGDEDLGHDVEGDSGD